MKGLQFLIFSFLLICCCGVYSTVNAQEVFSVGEQPWKSSADLNLTITAEISRTNQVLAIPDLQPSDKILTTAYQKMLTYLKADTQNNMPVGEAIMRSFKQVVTESDTDQSIKGLAVEHLRDLMPLLIESLTEIPQMVPQESH